MAAAPPCERLLAGVRAGRAQAVYLVAGEPVLAEPLGLELGRALAAPHGVAPEVHRRPARLAPLLADLRTYSLFQAAKVLVVVETALFADRAQAAQLLDEAAEGIAALAEGPDTPAVRRGARRLLAALGLFQIDPGAGEPAAAVGELPAWAFEGAGGARGGRRRGKPQIEELKAGLARLLAAAREGAMEAFAEGELAQLAAILAGGLPPGHALVLVERSVAEGHPLVQALAAREAILLAGRVEGRKGGGWQGLEALAAELARETGVSIAPEALDELARRTLRLGGQGAPPAGGGAVAAASTQRLAAEYRKLANLVPRPSAGSPRIGRELVAEAVEDRGEEDVWALLDAIGSGDGAGALTRLRRLLASAEDAGAARLLLWARLADYGRLLAAAGGRARELGLPAGERGYARFKARWAERLQADLEGGLGNPLATVHPFRLHRAYLAAARLPAATLARLPWRLLEAELRLKGESDGADAVLAELVAELAAPGAPAGAARAPAKP